MKPIAFILILILFAGTREIKTDDLYHKILMAESGYNDNAESHRGAIGRWQITTAGLDHFNTFNKYRAHYTTNDIKIPNINDSVGRWIIETLIKEWDGSIIHAVNSYNMGSANTMRGKFYDAYCYKILGVEYTKWRRKKKAYKKIGGVYYLK